MKIISIKDACDLLSIAKASYYRLALLALVPKPFKITPNRSVVFAADIDAVIMARASGSGDDQIKELVSNLVAQRSAIQTSAEAM